ncbi:hypothetical protein GCM10027348_15130 [Hymenobacter tenuis]
MFLSVSVFLVACQKEDAPTGMEGRWSLQSSYYDNYDQTGNRISGYTDQLDTLGVYLIVTKDNMRTYNSRNQEVLRFEYTREGNVLHITAFAPTSTQSSQYDLTLEELTDKRMLTRFTGQPNPATGVYIMSGSLYTR